MPYGYMHNYMCTHSQFVVYSYVCWEHVIEQTIHEFIINFVQTLSVSHIRSFWEHTMSNCEHREQETPIMATYSYRGVEYQFVSTEKQVSIPFHMPHISVHAAIEFT